MKKKIRLTRTMVIEYEPVAEHYIEGLTIEQMAEVDANTDDIDLLFDQELSKDEVTWEIIDSQRSNKITL